MQGVLSARYREMARNRAVTPMAGKRGEGETGKGRQRDFPNAFQPTELNVIMHGEDFIIGR